MNRISDVFQNLSLVVAKLLIESFGEEGCMQNAMEDYMDCSFKDDPHTPERWGKFKMMVEYGRTQAITQGDWTIGDDGKVLLGHVIPWLFVSGNVDCSAARCLFFVKAHQPNVFLVRNNQGRTLLAIVIRYRASRFYYGRNGRKEIVRLVVQED